MGSGFGVGNEGKNIESECLLIMRIDRSSGPSILGIDEIDRSSGPSIVGIDEIDRDVPAASLPWGALVWVISWG